MTVPLDFRWCRVPEPNARTDVIAATFGGLVMNERQTILWIASIFGSLVLGIFVLDIIAMP